MSEVYSMVTALTLIIVILLSSGSRIFIRHHYQKKLRPHMEALEQASKRNAQVNSNG